MAFFDGTNKIPARGNSSRFKPGNYPAIRVDKCSVKDGYNGLRFIMEGVPLVEGQATETDKDGNMIQPTPVGTTGSWTVQIDGKWGDLGKGEAKAFAAACLGMTPEECEGQDMEAHLEASIGPDQPLAGCIVATEAHGHVTKSGFPMTKHVWTVPEDRPAAAPIPPAPPAPPAASPPPPPVGIPAGYFHFPEGDPRHGVEVYNAEGSIIKL